MSERLFDRHQKRVQEGARRYLEQRRTLRDFVGPGGVKLNREEQLGLYREALNDPDMMLGILQNRQQVNKMPPDQVPKDFIEWLDRMAAMEATESTPTAEPPNTPRR